jgi:hypothetical protein
MKYVLLAAGAVIVHVLALGVTFRIAYWDDVDPRLDPVVLVRVKLPVNEIANCPATAVST